METVYIYKYRKNVLRLMLFVELLGAVMVILGVMRARIAYQDSQTDMLIKSIILIVTFTIVTMTGYIKYDKASKNRILLDTSNKTLSILYGEKAYTYSLDSIVCTFESQGKDKEFKVINKLSDSILFNDNCMFDLRGLDKVLKDS